MRMKIGCKGLGKRIAEFDRIGETRGEGENWLQGIGEKDSGI